MKMLPRIFKWRRLLRLLQLPLLCLLLLPLQLQLQLEIQLQLQLQTGKLAEGVQGGEGAAACVDRSVLPHGKTAKHQQAIQVKC